MRDFGSHGLPEVNSERLRFEMYSQALKPKEAKPSNLGGAFRSVPSRSESATLYIYIYIYICIYKLPINSPKAAVTRIGMKVGIGIEIRVRIIIKTTNLCNPEKIRAQMDHAQVCHRKQN